MSAPDNDPENNPLNEDNVNENDEVEDVENLPNDGGAEFGDVAPEDDSESDSDGQEFLEAEHVSLALFCPNVFVVVGSCRCYC